MPAQDGPGERGRTSPDPSPDAGAWGREDALQRLEDQLLGYPDDRALPPIVDIVTAADVPPALLREDDRARKLIVEALLARPLSQLDRVSGLRTEVEVLTLEVEVLTERLNSSTVGTRGAADAVDRLQQVRARLMEIKAIL